MTKDKSFHENALDSLESNLNSANYSQTDVNNVSQSSEETLEFVKTDVAMKLEALIKISGDIRDRLGFAGRNDNIGEAGSKNPIPESPQNSGQKSDYDNFSGVTVDTTNIPEMTRLPKKDQLFIAALTKSIWLSKYNTSQGSQQPRQLANQQAQNNPLSEMMSLFGNLNMISSNQGMFGKAAGIFGAAGNVKNLMGPGGIMGGLLTAQIMNQMGSSISQQNPQQTSNQIGGIQRSSARDVLGRNPKQESPRQSPDEYQKKSTGIFSGVSDNVVDAIGNSVMDYLNKPETISSLSDVMVGLLDNVMVFLGERLSSAGDDVLKSKGWFSPVQNSIKEAFGSSLKKTGDSLSGESKSSGGGTGVGGKVPEQKFESGRKSGSVTQYKEGNTPTGFEIKNREEYFVSKQTGERKDFVNTSTKLGAINSLSNEFLDKVDEISNELGIPQQDLLSLMYYQTKGSFNPAYNSKNPRKVGLIGFDANTSNKTVGMSPGALGSLGAVEQLEYVKRYLKPFAESGKLHNVTDLFAAVNYPDMAGTPVDSAGLVRDKKGNLKSLVAGESVYDAMKHLDLDGDKIINKEELISEDFFDIYNQMGGNYVTQKRGKAAGLQMDPSVPGVANFGQISESPTQGNEGTSIIDQIFSSLQTDRTTKDADNRTNNSMVDQYYDRKPEQQFGNQQNVQQSGQQFGNQQSGYEGESQGQYDKYKSGKTDFKYVSKQLQKEFENRGFPKEQSGVFAKAATAQLIQEVGWEGKSTVGSNNFFNIKETGTVKGDMPGVQAFDSREGSNDFYASYSSPEKGISGYVDFLTSNPRYEKAGLFQSTSVEEYAGALQRAGFATDPNYASQIASIANGKRLNGIINSTIEESQQQSGQQFGNQQNVQQSGQQFGQPGQQSPQYSETQFAENSEANWPPVEGVFTSSFGQRAAGYHRGVDIGGNDGKSINPVLPGTVVVAKTGEKEGNWIRIDHGDGTQSDYMHMKNRPNFNVGDSVSTGDVIGNVGNTGGSRGSHLHFAFLQNGQQVDPTSVFGSLGQVYPNKGYEQRLTPGSRYGVFDGNENSGGDLNIQNKDPQNAIGGPDGYMPEESQIKSLLNLLDLAETVRSEKIGLNVQEASAESSESISDSVNDFKNTAKEIVNVAMNSISTSNMSNVKNSTSTVMSQSGTQGGGTLDILKNTINVFFGDF